MRLRITQATCKMQQTPLFDLPWGVSIRSCCGSAVGGPFVAKGSIKKGQSQLERTGPRCARYESGLRKNYCMNHGHSPYLGTPKRCVAT